MKQAGVPGQVATIQNLLNADPAQDPGSSLTKERGQGGKLSVVPGSPLDRTLTALCADKEAAEFALATATDQNGTPGGRGAPPRPVKAREIRTLLKVRHSSFSFSGPRCSALLCLRRR